MTEEIWSQWLDLDQPNIGSVPDSPGVFVMHASMKVLFIGSNQNIRKGLADSLADGCCSKAKRFRYMLTSSPDLIKQKLLKEFAEKHAGKLPPCNI